MDLVVATLGAIRLLCWGRQRRRRGEPDTGSAPATSAGTHHQWAVLQRELPVVRQLLRNWRRLPAPSDCRSRAPGSRLPFHSNDVPPYRLLSLLALRRQRRGDLDRSLPLRNLPKVRGGPLEWRTRATLSSAGAAVAGLRGFEPPDGVLSI